MNSAAKRKANEVGIMKGYEVKFKNFDSNLFEMINTINDREEEGIRNMKRFNIHLDLSKDIVDLYIFEQHYFLEEEIERIQKFFRNEHLNKNEDMVAKMVKEALVIVKYAKVSCKFSKIFDEGMKVNFFVAELNKELVQVERKGDYVIANCCVDSSHFHIEVVEDVLGET